MLKTVRQMKLMMIRRLAVLAFLTATTLTATAQDQSHKASYYVSRAESFIQSDAWAAAKREIDNGLEEWPDDANLRYLNGRYYYVTGHMKEARYNLIRAIQTDDRLFKAKRVMVDVEDASKHYSSAICYINELLEFQPYDRDLWRRKISLYRKTNNEAEANAALERLARIYPNDSLVRKDLAIQHRRSVEELMKKSNAEQAALELEKWLEMDPDNLSYYIELMGLYQQMGENDRAIGVGNRGLTRFPNNAQLLNKTIGLLAERGNYEQALRMARKNPSSRAYTGLLQEAAVNARVNDPYEMNGRLYAETHDSDALNYLLNTSLTRGYFEDARAYLADAMKREGRTPRLLMKLYTLEKRMGNETAMRRVMQELYQSSPDDVETRESCAEMMLRIGSTDMAQQQWADADDHLQQAIGLMSVSHESWPAAVSMRIVCLTHLNRFDDARELFLQAAKTDRQNRNRYASAYEDMVAVRLHSLIEDESYGKALAEAQELLKVIPESEAALRCCINMSQTLNHEDLYEKYAEIGYERFPDVPYFVIKQAYALRRQHRNEEALQLVDPCKRKDGEYESPQFIVALSGITGEWATELLKQHKTDAAMQIVDTALVHDPANKDLLYLKGVAYEQMKDYANAYHYLTHYYVPSNAEQSAYYEEMRYLGFRSLKNRIDASYTQAFFDNTQDDLAARAHLYSLASISYSRLEKNDVLTGQVSYKGIDGYHNKRDSVAGGAGLSFMAQWDHTFNRRWSGMANASLSTRYFNKVGVNVSASYAMDRGWTPSLRLGYRRTPKTYLYMSTDTLNSEFNLFLLTPSIEKSWERISTSVNFDLISMRSSLYYNVGMKGKFLFNDDNISSVTLLAGFGSFPELNFFEQTALRNISHTNTMVGFDLRYLLSRHLYLEVEGDWNTCFSPYFLKNGQLVDSYRNIYSLTFQIHMAF